MSAVESFEQTLRTLIAARHPHVWVNTFEELRLEELLWNIAKNPAKGTGVGAKRLFICSTSEGLVERKSVPGKGVIRQVVDPKLADPLLFFATLPSRLEKDAEQGAIYLFRDLHRPLAELAACYRFVRDLTYTLRESFATLVTASPWGSIPQELRKDLTMVDMPFPSMADLGEVVDYIFESEDLRQLKIPSPKGQEREAVLRAGLGLTAMEYSTALQESIVRVKRPDPTVIVRAKEQIIKKSGVVELTQSVVSMDDVGGLENLKRWITVHRYTEEAKAAGVDAPRAVLLVGPPGTGKTYCARAIASAWGQPFVSLTRDRVLGGIVGQSEQNMRQALKTAEAAAPDILFVDEGEKFLAGASGSGELDSGVMKGVHGMFLSWLEDHLEEVFVVMTVNDPRPLDPALMRRFDDVFYVALPNPVEREAILRIHLRQHKLDPEDFDLLSLAGHTNLFSGGELKKLVRHAIAEAYAAKHKLCDADLMAAVPLIHPVAESRAADIEAMEAWAKTNAIPASDPDAPRIAARRSRLEMAGGR